MVSTTDFGSVDYRSSRYTSTSFCKNILACCIRAITLDSGSRNVGSTPAMPTASAISITVIRQTSNLDMPVRFRYCAQY